MNFNGQENAGYGFGVPGAPTPPGAGRGDAGVMMMNGNNNSNNNNQNNMNPMQVNGASFAQNSTQQQQQQQQQQQYLQPQQQQWMNQRFFPYSGTALNNNNQQQQPLQPFLGATTSVSRATLGLSNVVQQLNTTFQLVADTIQLLNVSQNNSNSNNNSSELAEARNVDICRQGFQVVMQQLQQTQHLVRGILQTMHLEQRQRQNLQRQQQQEQEDDGEPIQFPHPLEQQVDMMQRQEEQHNPQQQFLSEETQRVKLPTNDNGGNSPDSFAETAPANDTRRLDQQQRSETLPTNDNGIFNQEQLPQPQNQNMNTIENATTPKPQTQPKRSNKHSTVAAPHRNEYKRRAERPLPEVPAPNDNAKQYTKQQAMEILVETDAKNRNRLVTGWIARKLVPVTAHTTMNKYMREFRENHGVVAHEWERVDDVDENGISKRLKVPEPANAVEYTRREAVRILLDISKEKGKVRDRNMVVTSWIAQGKIPLKSLTAVDRSIQQAEKEGIDSLQEHWGRWGDTQYQKQMKKDQALEARREKMKRASNSASNQEDDASNTTKRKKKKKTTPTPTAVVLPPFPAPIYGNEYTKLEAVSILQKINNPHDRNNVICKWIHEKQIPVSHPNSMTRILREAKNNTLRNLDWKDGATVKSNLPWTPSPRNGSTYTKAEMIDILSKMNATDRNKLVRLWVHDKKIPYTSALAANNVKAIREQQQNTDALGNGDNRINTSAVAATGPSRKKRKLPDANSETAPDGKVGDSSMETAGA